MRKLACVMWLYSLNHLGRVLKRPSRQEPVKHCDNVLLSPRKAHLDRWRVAFAWNPHVSADIEATTFPSTPKTGRAMFVTLRALQLGMKIPPVPRSSSICLSRQSRNQTGNTMASPPLVR